MKFSVILLLAFFLLTKFSFSQNRERVNSGELIRTASALHDSAKNKSALALYNQVTRSDTNYVWSLLGKAISCEADSQYSNAVKYCQEALALKEQRNYEPDIYNTYGNTLNDMGQHEQAIKVFDIAIAKYPAYSLLYFNKGIVMSDMKRYHDAELLFQKTLLVNPYMYSAHYQLAVAAMMQGKIIPSFLGAIGYLLTNPSGKYMSKCINLLNQVSKSTDEILAYKNNRTEMPDGNYQAVEEIVLSKIALEKEYKPIIALDDAISRQIQAVFEKLEYRDDDNDFYSQYYLPYFKQTYSGGKFELFINHIFSSVNIPVIQEYNKKNKKELDAFINEAAQYFDQIRQTREISYKKRDTISSRYYFENGELMGKGVLLNKGKTLVGNWFFYYPSGNIKGKGTYNADGKREGNFYFYYSSGKLKAKENYSNGKLEGRQENYFENGNLSSEETYANDLLEGTMTSYYYAGCKKSVDNYKQGKKDGEERNYYSNGDLRSTFHFVNDVQTGDAREYYKNGHVKEVSTYVNGKAEGPYKSYFENGSVSGEGQFVKDKSDGEWKYYYKNGKLREKRNYANNQENGPHLEYFDSGELSQSYQVKNDKMTGEATNYFKDGKPLSVSTYDNGNIKAIKYFSHNGTLLSSAETSGKSASIVSYNEDGNKVAHFGYNKKGDLDGPDTIFFASGKIQEINNYKNGEIDGISVSYYLNGGKKSEITMVNGKQDGLYTGYYANGKIQATGWFKDGQNDSEWNYYDELGRLNTRCYYLDGDINGYKESFLPNGQKTLEQKYHRGWLENMTQYVDQGKVMAVDSFLKASGKFVRKYPNGQIMEEGNYVNGDFDGSYKTYFFDGSIESTTFFRRGQKDSTYVGYYYGGLKSYEGRFSNNGKTGVWKSYDEKGIPDRTTNYDNDQENGEMTYYYPDGKIDFVALYKDGELDGLAKKYDPNGTLAYQVNYKEGDAKSYSYLDKENKLLPFIPIDIKNGIMKSYFPNGKPSRECTFIDGIKNGKDILYYDNGQMRSTDNYVFGNLEGNSVNYYNNGKLKSEYHYVINNPTGKCQDYNENGILVKNTEFDNGLNHGPQNIFDATGKPVKTLTYQFGTLTAVKNEK